MGHPSRYRSTDVAAKGKEAEMASRERTPQELVREALDAHDLARKTGDPLKRATMEKAADELLQQAEKALAKQQGDKPILGT
jgi:hypothetical protein